MENNSTAKKKQRRSFGGGSSSSSRVGGGLRAIAGGGGGFGGFCTAWEAKDTIAIAAAAAAAQQATKENRDVQSTAGAANDDDGGGGGGKPRAENNTYNSDDMDEEEPTAGDAYGPPPSPPPLTSAAYATLPLSHPISLTLTLRGTQFRKDDVDNKVFYSLLKKGSTELTLEREPANEHDALAIRVGYYLAEDKNEDDDNGSSDKSNNVNEGREKGRDDDDNKMEAGDTEDSDAGKKKSTEGDDDANNKDGAEDDDADGNNNNGNNNGRQLKSIGYIAKEQAKILSPYLDAGCLRLDAVTVGDKDTTNRGWQYKLRVTGMAKDIATMLLDLEKPLFSNIVDVDSFLSKGLGKIDLEESKSAHYSIDELPPPMPWMPVPQYENKEHAPNTQVGWLWEPFDPNVATRVLPTAEVEDAQAAQWPPSDDILASLGMGPKDDAAWWSDVAGLKPPVEWNMTGPHDVMEKLAIFSKTKRELATDILDGAIHGVTSVWTDDMLEAMREAMHSKDFWCYRGQDAFIRSFGGPYVLGQKSGELKLIQGTPHTDLTAKICRGHNLVYAATHLKHPLGPKGFNVIVFGLNIRRGGFHFHKDHISGLTPKAAPLLDEQPVATTVFYERPDLDDGKEVVNWKPAKNWDGVQAKGGATQEQEERGTKNNNYYLSARTVRTYHGMIHIQRAGLQKKALHGIFHAPGDEDERQGYRVAITARVAWPDAEERIAPFIEKGDYCRTIGPNGQDQLPSSTI